MAAVEGRIHLAESHLRWAQDRLEWARQMVKKGHLLLIRYRSEEGDFAKAKYALEQAQSSRRVLIEYTAPKTIKSLRVEVEKARMAEADREADWEREVVNQAKLERLLDRT